MNTDDIEMTDSEEGVFGGAEADPDETYETENMDKSNFLNYHNMYEDGLDQYAYRKEPEYWS